jgi:protein-S-isoprenylcysteine O-methyltransferase
MRTLGAFYTRTLRVTGGQQLVEIGPYQRLRHPGYTGGLCIWIGASLATANWISSILVPVLMIGVYQYRIRSEEQMLLGAFGKNYGDYMRRTWRLVPFIY